MRLNYKMWKWVWRVSTLRMDQSQQLQRGSLVIWKPCDWQISQSAQYRSDIYANACRDIFSKAHHLCRRFTHFVLTARGNLHVAAQQKMASNIQRVHQRRPTTRWKQLPHRAKHWLWKLEKITVSLKLVQFMCEYEEVCRKVFLKEGHWTLRVKII